MTNIFLKVAQNQLGSANLEAQTTGKLLNSFFGKIIQWVAMTRFPVGSKMRCHLERWRGVKIGKRVFISGGNILDRTRPDLISIEDDVSLAGNVIILTHSSPTAPLREILGASLSVVYPVHIKRGARIAVNVVILPGVTIGECCIISSGSVVKNDIPGYTIASGSPAKVTHKLPFQPAST
ncbi:MAG: acyltransferase [Bacteroidetes bacterium]|nr:acyltransferase [Bacteroidota bacterium]